MFFRFIDSYQENNELKDELKYLVEDYNRVIISALNLSNQSQRNVNYSTQANYSTTQLNYRDYPISNENSKIENVTTNNMKPNIDSHNDSIDGNMLYSTLYIVRKKRSIILLSPQNNVPLHRNNNKQSMI